MKELEVIQQVLEKSTSPMTIQEIVEVANASTIHFGAEEPFTYDQVLSLIEERSDLFDSAAGITFLSTNEDWQQFRKSISYLENLIWSHGGRSEGLLYLLFYKRISDIGLIPEDIRLGNVRNVLFHSSHDVGEVKFNEVIYCLNQMFPDLESGLSKLKKVFSKDYNRTIDLNLIEVISILNSFDTSFLTPLKFGPIYEDLIRKVSQKSLGQFRTPRSVKEIMIKLLDIKPGASIYDPFMGFAGLLTEALKLNRNIKIHGSEIDRLAYEIGLMNLIVHGYEQEGRKVWQVNSLEIEDQNKFDFVITSPPFGTRIEYWKYPKLDLGIEFSSGRKQATPLFIELVRSKLKSTGKAVILLPEGFFFTGGFLGNYRKRLVEEGIVSGVISVPNSSFVPYSSVKASILIIENSPRQALNEITFIDTNEFIEKKQLLADLVRTAYQNRHERRPGVSVVPLSEVTHNNSEAFSRQICRIL